jgi:hypothetical protein
LGTIKKGAKETVRKISKEFNLKMLQKIALLGSAHILRKVGI